MACDGSDGARSGSRWIFAVACVALASSPGCSSGKSTNASDDVGDDTADTMQGNSDDVGGDSADTMQGNPDDVGGDSADPTQGNSDDVGPAVGSDPSSDSTGDGNASDVELTPATGPSSGATSEADTSTADAPTGDGDQGADAAETQAAGDDLGDGVSEAGAPTDGGGPTGSEESPGTVGGVCGSVTCAANEYCAAPCSGIGLVPDEAKPRCAELPSECNGIATCECICGETAPFCTPGAPEVQCGCG